MIWDLFSLKDKVTVITGATSQEGLGFAMARALGQAGSSILLTGRREEELKKTVQVLMDEGLDVYALRADASTKEGVEQVREFIMSKFGRLDVLINNAGTGAFVPAIDTDYEKDWQRIFRTNVDGYFLMAQMAAKIMIPQGGGSIINISSKSGTVVDIPNQQAAYNTSKGAVNMLTKSLAVEWAPFNIRVNAIAPGNMITSHTHNGDDGDLPSIWVNMNPMKRLGRPDELGGAALYLASEASSYVTGSILEVDGGFTII